METPKESVSEKKECESTGALGGTQDGCENITPGESQEQCLCAVCVRYLNFRLNDSSWELSKSKTRMEILETELDSLKTELKETRRFSLQDQVKVGCLCDQGMQHADERFPAAKAVALRQLRERVAKSFDECLSTVVGIQEDEIHNLGLPFQALDKSPCKVRWKDRPVSLGSLAETRKLDFSTEDSPAKQELVKRDTKQALGETLSLLMSGLHTLSPEVIVRKAFKSCHVLEYPRVLKSVFFVSIWSECFRTHGLQAKWKQLDKAVDNELRKLLHGPIGDSPRYAHDEAQPLMRPANL